MSSDRNPIIPHIERMRNSRIPKQIYVGECVGSHLVFQPWKRWIDTVNECFKKSGFVFEVSKENGA